MCHLQLAELHRLLGAICTPRHGRFLSVCGCLYVCVLGVVEQEGLLQGLFWCVCVWGEEMLCETLSSFTETCVRKRTRQPAVQYTCRRDLFTPSPMLCG